jgi:hypothetical protein
MDAVEDGENILQCTDCKKVYLVGHNGLVCTVSGCTGKLVPKNNPIAFNPGPYAKFNSRHPPRERVPSLRGKY